MRSRRIRWAAPVLFLVAGLILCAANLTDRILLDNMTVEQMAAAVAARDKAGARPELEASGGMDLSNVRAAAGTGVDFISIGSLTHSAPVLDFSMLVEPA